MPKINLTRREKALVARGGGAAVLPHPTAKGQRRRAYYNEYNERIVLPGDARNLEFYLEKGFTLTPRPNPSIRPTSGLVGVEDWDGTKQDVQLEAAPPAAPVATYYTPDGHPVPNLPADPASMAAYMEQGLTLSPPAKLRAAEPERPQLRVVATERRRRTRRFRRTG